MKKIALLLVLAVSLYSCGTDDDGRNLDFAVAEIIGTDLPEYFEIGESYDVEISYKLPNACHQFSNFSGNQYESEEIDSTFVIEIAALTSFDANLTECTQEGVLNKSSSLKDLRILSENYNNYKFKLVTGEDENGEGEFLIIDVPVGEPEAETPEDNTNE